MDIKGRVCKDIGVNTNYYLIPVDNMYEFEYKFPSELRDKAEKLLGAIVVCKVDCNTKSIVEIVT